MTFYSFSAMKKILVFLLFCLSPAFLPAQEQEAIEIPDLDQILKNTTDSGSPFYYPLLMERYQKNDTTLTLEDYRHLYLGYSFQEGYDPYRISPYHNELKALYTQVEDKTADSDSIIKYATLALDDSPFDLREINLLVYGYKVKGDKKQETEWSYKLQGLLDAILSTGDGLSPDSAWFVIQPAHEYDIVNRLGLTATQYTYIEPSFDYLEVNENPFKIKGYYFNAKRMIEEYLRKFK